MDEQRHNRQEGSASKRGIAKLLSFGALSLFAMLVLSACGPDGEKPYSTVSPASTQADDIHSLYKLVFWLSLVVFVGVQFAIVYLSLRYRRKKSDTKRPPQVHGHKQLELVWTIIPAVVLLILLVPTLNILFDHDAQAREGTLQVDVYGKQWWWEFHLGEDQVQDGASLDVVTANEIVIPVNRNTVFNLRSNNVIHSFWVPQLGGKLDVIPGHVNSFAITPTRTGEFYGECAEFCGAQHAWMRFKITVVEEDEFYAWVNNWRTSPAVSANQQEEGSGVIQAPQKFSVCLSCHTYNGAENSKALTGINAYANYGPDLTMLACRETFAAGMMEMTPENLKQWLLDPDSIKPGNYMSTMIGPGMAVEFTEEEADEFVEFFFSMIPEGGCMSPDGWNVSTGDAPAATPESTEATPAA
ncbi:MAG: cytochrome c oxidase subunit II [Thermomicrobiales bacterium]|nr:cytochrome c oxidase subunit II [Thermomicrobiales bacterium]MCO5219602.1 cytochrome c oxidase subunit II [Thermomicrobiales bacterium]